MENNKRLLGMGVTSGKKRTHKKQLDFSQFNEEYVGTFIFHHPSLMERMQIGVLKSQMLQGLDGRVDVTTDNIAHMSATLEVILDESPKWFNLSTIEDYEVLDGVYEEYIQWYESFRKRRDSDDDKGDSE